MATDDGGPKRLYTVSIKIGADSWQGVVQSLYEAAQAIEHRGHVIDSAMGGPSGNWIIQGAYNPGQTHDKYFEDLAIWHAARKQKANAAT